MYKNTISFLCTPIDKTTQKNFYKIKFSYQYKFSYKNTRARSFYRCCTILRPHRCEIICTCFFTKLNFLSCVPIEKIFL